MAVIVSKASSVIYKGVFMVEFKCRCKVLNRPLEMVQLHLDTTPLNKELLAVGFFLKA